MGSAGAGGHGVPADLGDLDQRGTPRPAGDRPAAAPHAGRDHHGGRRRLRPATPAHAACAGRRGRARPDSGRGAGGQLGHAADQRREDRVVHAGDRSAAAVQMGGWVIRNRMSPVLLLALPFALTVAIALARAMVGPDWGLVPLLAVGPAVAAAIGGAAYTLAAGRPGPGDLLVAADLPDGGPARAPRGHDRPGRRGRGHRGGDRGQHGPQAPGA